MPLEVVIKWASLTSISHFYNCVTWSSFYDIFSQWNLIIWAQGYSLEEAHMSDLLQPNYYRITNPTACFWIMREKFMVSFFFLIQPDYSWFCQVYCSCNCKMIRIYSPWKLGYNGFDIASFNTASIYLKIFCAKDCVSTERDINVDKKESLFPRKEGFFWSSWK